jgi:hypothetical protein
MNIRVSGFAQAHRYWLLVAAVALAGVLFVGCGGDDGDSPPDGGGGGGTPNAGSASEPSPAAEGNSSEAGSGGELAACDLLTPEDVEALIGVAPEPDTQPVGPFQVCAYWDTMTNFVQFQVCRCLSGSEFDASAEAGADALGIEIEEVDGIGDKAYWFSGILWVQSGDIAFNLWISRAAYYTSDGTALEGDALKDVSLPDTQALAQTILDRLD